MSIDLMNEKDLSDVGEVVNRARVPLEEIAMFLAERGFKGRVTLPLFGGAVAVVLGPEEARRFREVLG